VCRFSCWRRSAGEGEGWESGGLQKFAKVAKKQERSCTAAFVVSRVSTPSSRETGSAVFSTLVSGRPRISFVDCGAGFTAKSSARPGRNRTSREVLCRRHRSRPVTAALRGRFAPVSPAQDAIHRPRIIKAELTWEKRVDAGAEGKGSATNSH
jgi:hypothetical protein